MEYPESRKLGFASRLGVGNINDVILNATPNMESVFKIKYACDFDYYYQFVLSHV
jgi:hypothetical protein